MSRRLFKSTAIVGSGTFASRVLGLARDVLIARFFGAAAGVDAFLVAFRIPNMLRRFSAEGAFSQAFVPVLAEAKEAESHAAVRDLASHVFGTLGGLLVAITLIGVTAAPILVLLFAPGFTSQPDKHLLAVEMLRIMFPYILFISLTAFAGAVLNTFGRFGVPAFTPVLLNLSLIASAIWLAPRFEQPVVALAWGVLIAGVVQLVFQLPFLLRIDMLVWPRIKRTHAGVKRMLRLILPAVFGVSVQQINILVDTVIASFLVTGSVTWLYYSDRMVEFPLGVFGIALATVILPNLSRQHAEGSSGIFSDTLDWALRLTTLVALPAALALAVLAGPLLSTLFQYGRFGSHDVSMASLSLMAYSLGLVGFVGVKILAPGFYARQDMRTPVRVGLIAMGSNVVLNLALVVPLAHAGLALATSLSALANAGLLLAGLRREAVFVPRSGWTSLLLRAAIANAAMVALLWWGRGAMDAWFEAELWARIAHLAVLVVGGTIAYVLGLLMLGFRPRDFVGPR